MTILRSSRKREAFFIGFVKKSAGFSLVETWGTTNSKDLTMIVAHEEVPALHVLHAVMVLRVVRDVARALRVGHELSGPRLGLAETTN